MYNTKTQTGHTLRTVHTLRRLQVFSADFINSPQTSHTLRRLYSIKLVSFISNHVVLDINLLSKLFEMYF